VFESTLSIESYVNVTFVNCTFIGNQGSAIYAFQTDIIFQGKNTFHKNSGKLGAGLSLFVNSFLYLKPHTNLLFSNNKAQYFGGAIFTDLEVEIPEACRSDVKATLNWYFQLVVMSKPSLWCLTG